MATELLEQRFLPIKCHDVKLNWVGLLVWDNEKNLLHGPFQVPGSMLGTNEFMDGYKWEDDELYVYFLCKIDYSIRGLRNGKAVFEEVWKNKSPENFGAFCSHTDGNMEIINGFIFTNHLSKKLYEKIMAGLSRKLNIQLAR